MLLGALGESLLRDMLFGKKGKGVIRAGEGVIRAGEELLKLAMDLKDLQSKKLH